MGNGLEEYHLTGKKTAPADLKNFSVDHWGTPANPSKPGSDNEIFACLWILYRFMPCSTVSEKVKSFRLSFFGHLPRSAPEEDHHCVIAAVLRPPPDWWRLETSWSSKIHQAESDRWRRSAPERWGPHGLEEGKGQGCLASSRQYGNALLGVCH